jgi:hypothetical protein
MKLYKLIIIFIFVLLFSQGFLGFNDELVIILVNASLLLTIVIKSKPWIINYFSTVRHDLYDNYQYKFKDSELLCSEAINSSSIIGNSNDLCVLFLGEFIVLNGFITN